MLRFRDLRGDHDLTQQQCAEIANISENSYIRYENEMRAAPSDVIIALYFGSDRYAPKIKIADVFFCTSAIF